MTHVIAVDAGGTHTRAVCLDERGMLRGAGIAGGGNPTSSGKDAADRELGRAIRQAVSRAGADPRAVTGVVCAAGEQDVGRLASIANLAGLVQPGALTLTGDAIAAYASTCDEEEGFVAVVGTGAIVTRVRDGAAAEITDGAGWLLGDDGGGFWIGRRVARAVAADLGGRGASTRLTPLVMRSLPPAAGGRWGSGRSAEIASLMSAVYDRAPMALAELAPLAFQAEAADAVSARIVAEAESAVAHTLRVARGADRGLPVIGAGSVLLRGFLAPGRAPGEIAREISDGHFDPSSGGIAGAAVLALARIGVDLSARERQALAIRIDIALATGGGTDA